MLLAIVKAQGILKHASHSYHVYHTVQTPQMQHHLHLTCSIQTCSYSAAFHNMAHKENFPDTRTAKYCYKHCGYEQSDYVATVVMG